MSDINPLMSAPAPKSTSSGRTNFASVKQEPAKKMTAAQIKKKAAAAAAHRNSGMNSASQEQRQQVLRQQQQRLLLLRHASKCEAGTPGNPKECPATKHCAQMKKLWSHIAKCKNQHCSTPHCVSSRYVLSHYHRCKDQNCSVCSPVRDAIQRHKDKRSNVDKPKPKATKPRKLTKAQLAKIERDKKKAAAAAEKLTKKRAAPGKGTKAAAAKKKKLDKPTTKAGTGTKIVMKRPDAPRVRHFTTSMITAFTRGQIEQHIKSLQQNFSFTFTPVMLRMRLAPLLKKLIDDDYGWVFDKPVDPSALNLPDYADIVKRPMDLGTIKKNLDGTKYSLPEAFARDVRLVFDNAMLYNPEGEDVHSIAQRLKTSFNEEFEQVKKAMAKAAKEKQAKNSDNVCAICYGEHFKLQTPIYTCNGKCQQRIRRNAHYFVDPTAKVHFCLQCYNDLPPSTTVNLGGTTGEVSVTKNDLKKKKHDEDVDEDWVECEKCKKWVHQICGLYNQKLDKNKKGQAPIVRKGFVEKYEFYCPMCLLKKMNDSNLQKHERLTKKSNKCAADLEQSNMAHYIEEMLNRKLKLLRKAEAEERGVRIDRVPSPEIFIRTILNRDELLDVHDQMYRRYKCFDYPREMGYNGKCILLFQRIDGVDVLLFGMYVQEFDEHTVGANKRSVYISYLDSVKYFSPSHWRTPIFQELMIAYFSYARERGFAYGFLWACPPEKGDDYILYCKPEDQKTPKPDRLKNWYYSFLHRAEAQGLVYNIDTMWNQYFAIKSDPLKTIEKLQDVASGPSAAAKAATECIVNSKSKRIPKPKRSGSGIDKDEDEEKKKKKTTSKKKEDNKVRPDLTVNNLPYFNGDFWPGLAETKITELTKTERESHTKAVFEANLAGPGPRQKRRKKNDTDPQAELMKQEGGDSTSPFGVYNKGDPDTLAKMLGEGLSMMKDDFIVIQLLPRCWNCEEYILSEQRYVCKRSRERGHKKYILCKECFDCIPEDHRAVVDTMLLVNSVTTAVDKKTLLDLKQSKRKGYTGRPSSIPTAAAAVETAVKGEVSAGAKGSDDAMDVDEPKPPSQEELMAKFKERFGEHTFDGKREFICEKLPAPIPKPSKDPNPKVEHEIFTARQQFLSMCQGNHYQYDQLRRAKHSSMMVLYHLHNPQANAFAHSCNHCQQTIDGDFYRCTDKNCDFDLCIECRKKVKHEHDMELKGHEIKTEDPQQRQRSIALHMQLLVHASKCINAECPSGNCKKMKSLLKHGKTCEKKSKGGCTVCRRIWALLQIHARGCRAPQGTCTVPRCKELKEYLRQQRIREADKRRNNYTNLQQTAAASVSSSRAASTASAAGSEGASTSTTAGNAGKKGKSGPKKK
jgi:hypothetical protein